MECCRRERAALRSHVTRGLSECLDGMQSDLHKKTKKKNEAEALHARLSNLTKNPKVLNNEIGTLVTDTDYNDRILSRLRRLQQQIDCTKCQVLPHRQSITELSEQSKCKGVKSNCQS